MTIALIRLIQSWLLLALGVLISAHIIPGISYSSTSSLIVVVILLSFLNAFLKPILLIFTFPFIILTMGLGILIINAFLFLIAGNLVSGFEVAGFGSAFLGALIVSLINIFMNSFLKGPPRKKGGPFRTIQRENREDDDVIDI